VSLDDIKNFLPVDARIGTAGQPSEAELAKVAAEGYQAVVNLGLLNAEYCLPDEAGLAASVGMRYRHLPVNFDAPAVETGPTATPARSASRTGPGRRSSTNAGRASSPAVRVRNSNNLRSRSGGPTIAAWGRA
jgi:hypothetical protein